MMYTKKLSLIFIAAVLLVCILSCGNPLIKEEYKRVAGAGDTLTYTIASFADASKIQSHPNGSFLITSEDDIELVEPIAEFTGKIQGAGPAQILVNGMFCKKATGAAFRDITFVQNGGAPRELDILGVVAGEAENTQFVNVQVKGSFSAVKTSGKNVVIGAIAGSMDSESVMERCGAAFGVTVSVSTAKTVFAGGLAGKNAGKIQSSYSRADVTVAADGSITAGGLAGENTGSIKDSYYIASMPTGTQADGQPVLGGLAGANTGSMENSYCKGPASVTGSGSGQTNCQTDYFSSAPSKEWIVYANVARLLNTPDPSW